MPDETIVSAKQLQSLDGSQPTSRLYVMILKIINDQGNNEGEEISK